jgi:peptidoglycan/LPS O-acetylase OafA/YrhL
MRPFPYRPFGALRLLLALMVVAVHFTVNVGPAWFAPLGKAYPIGYTAVLAFFAMSGFIIVETADRIYQHRPLAFMLNRWLRIVPQFLMTMALTIGICWLLARTHSLIIERDGPALPPSTFGTRNLVLNFVSFLPLVDKHIDFNFVPIAWTLRVEMMFYGVVMLILTMLLVWRLSLRMICVGCLIVFVPLFGLALMGRTPPSLLFIPYFALGAAAYAILSRRSMLAACLACISFGGIALEFHARSNGSLLQFLLLTVLLGAMIWLATKALPSLRRIDRRSGDITYPLYLGHAWVGVLFTSLTNTDTFTGLFIAVAVSLLVAEASRRLVDTAIDRVRSRIRATPQALPTGQGVIAAE